MKHSSHPFDEYLQKRVDEAELPYKDAYWQQMSEMLDQRDKGDRKFPFWKGFGLTVITGILVGGIYLFTGSQNRSQKSSQAIVQQGIQSAVPITLQKSQNAMSHETAPSGHAHPVTRALTPVNTDHSPESQIASLKEQRSTPKSAIKQPDHLVSEERTTQQTIASTMKGDKFSEPALADASGGMVPSRRGRFTRLASQQPSQVTGNPSINSSGEVSEKVPIENLKPIHKNQQGQSSVRLKPKRGIRRTGTDAGAEPIITKTTTQLQPLDNPLQSVAPDLVKQGKFYRAADTQRFVRTQLTPEQTNPRYVASLHDYLPTRLDSVTIIAYTELTPPDVSMASQTQSIPQAEEKVHVLEPIRKSTNAYITANLQANNAWKGNNGQGGVGFSPQIGFGLERQLSHKLSLATQIGFGYLNKLHTNYQITHYQMGFGLDSSKTSISFQRLWQLSIPVMLSYHILPGHWLMMGAALCLNWDVESEETNTSMSSNTGHPVSSHYAPVVTTQTRVFGYREAFMPLDWMVQAGYGWQFHPRWMAQIQVQQGLKDLSRESVFQDARVHRQTRVNLGVRFYFKRNQIKS